MTFRKNYRQLNKNLSKNNSTKGSKNHALNSWQFSFIAVGIIYFLVISTTVILYTKISQFIRSSTYSDFIDIREYKSLLSSQAVSSNPELTGKIAKSAFETARKHAANEENLSFVLLLLKCIHSIYGAPRRLSSYFLHLDMTKSYSPSDYLSQSFGWCSITQHFCSSATKFVSDILFQNLINNVMSPRAYKEIDALQHIVNNIETMPMALSRKEIKRFPNRIDARIFRDIEKIEPIHSIDSFAKEDDKDQQDEGSILVQLSKFHEKHYFYNLLCKIFNISDPMMFSAQWGIQNGIEKQIEVFFEKVLQKYGCSNENSGTENKYTKEGLRKVVYCILGSVLNSLNTLVGVLKNAKRLPSSPLLSILESEMFRIDRAYGYSVELLAKLNAERVTYGLNSIISYDIFNMYQCPVWLNKKDRQRLHKPITKFLNFHQTLDKSKTLEISVSQASAQYFCENFIAISDKNAALDAFLIAGAREENWGNLYVAMINFCYKEKCRDLVSLKKKYKISTGCDLLEDYERLESLFVRHVKEITFPNRPISYTDIMLTCANITKFEPEEEYDLKIMNRFVEFMI